MKDEGGRAANYSRKTLIGILAIVFLLGMLAFSFWPPTGSTGLEWQSACWRIGPLLAVLWLAYDELKRIPRWLWFVLPVAIFILVKWPKMMLLSIPFLILLAVLKLRLKGR
jgi:hypothetical protein